MTMEIKKRILKALIILIVLTLAPTYVSASSSPIDFIPDKSDLNSQNKSNGSMGDYFSGVSDQVNEYAPDIAFVFTAIFTVMFIFGLIRLAYALVTKTGMVLKGSTGVLIFIPLVFVFIRVFFILFFTTEGPGVTLLISGLLAVLIKAGYFSAIGMVLVGLLMRLFYNFLKHPEYSRWSKRLFAGAGIVVLLSAIIPTVLQSI